MGHFGLVVEGGGCVMGLLLERTPPSIVLLLIFWVAVCASLGGRSVPGLMRSGTARKKISRE